MTGSPETALREGARAILGRALTSAEVVKFLKYLDLLVKWQKVQRLVGSSEPGWIVDNLLLDSLLFLHVLPAPLGRLMDLGAGAGLPGIPLGIVLSATAVTLVEAKQKRASFLSAAVRDLGLGTARVINARAEDLPPELDGSFDAVVLRCAGPLADLMPVARRFMAPGGTVVAAGPPKPEPLSEGTWTNVPGRGPRGTRLFAVIK
jgi:16S rRNA (guanine527-N7)-methyltransferase